MDWMAQTPSKTCAGYSIVARRRARMYRRRRLKSLSSPARSRRAAVSPPFPESRPSRPWIAREPLISVTAALVADIYDRTETEVESDLRKMVVKVKASG
jgi:hypothetical protein